MKKSHYNSSAFLFPNATGTLLSSSKSDLLPARTVMTFLFLLLESWRASYQSSKSLKEDMLFTEYTKTQHYTSLRKRFARFFTLASPAASQIYNYSVCWLPSSSVTTSRLEKSYTTCVDNMLLLAIDEDSMKALIIEVFPTFCWPMNLIFESS